jgi:hypothetical protein
MMVGVNSSMTYLMYCKNFCKCHNVPQHNYKKLPEVLKIVRDERFFI